MERKLQLIFGVIYLDNKYVEDKASKIVIASWIH